MDTEELFTQHVRPLYPPPLNTNDEALAIARAIDANPSGNTSILSTLDAIATRFIEIAPAVLAVPLQLGFNDVSVHQLSHQLTRTTRDRLLHSASTVSQSSEIAAFIVHAAVYVGRCIVESHKAVFGVRNPLWESVVYLRSAAGDAELRPLSWLLRAFSDDEIDRGMLGARYRQYVERATFDYTSIPVLFPTHPTRLLPTLRVVRYDTLHKYLRTHVAELRDLGANFPSAGQLDELGFLALDFLVLGRGAMLLIHGRNRRGLHLFWLDYQGFSHGLFLPADPGDPHEISIKNNVMSVRFMYQRKAVVHELMWWG